MLTLSLQCIYYMQCNSLGIVAPTPDSAGMLHSSYYFSQKLLTLEAKVTKRVTKFQIVKSNNEENQLPGLVINLLVMIHQLF